jgi:hypothetical protein
LEGDASPNTSIDLSLASTQALFVTNNGNIYIAGTKSGKEGIVVITIELALMNGL